MSDEKKQKESGTIELSNIYKLIAEYRVSVRHTVMQEASDADRGSMGKAVHEEVAARTALEVAIRRLTY